MALNVKKITKQSASITLDMSKMGVENATVLKCESKSDSDVTSEIKSKEYGMPVHSYKSRNISKDTVSLDDINNDGTSDICDLVLIRNKINER